MKKVWILLLLALFLMACGAQETFETVEDLMPIEPVASPRLFFVSLPEGTAAPTFRDESGELYVCQDYTIQKQVLEGGDLERTVMALTGLAPEQLQILKTAQDTFDRYDFVWTAAGEDGLQLGRACILDDGDFHYALTAMAREEKAGALQQTIRQMLDSCKLLDPEEGISTGS